MTLLFGRNVLVQIGNQDEAVEIGNDFKISFDIQHMLSGKIWRRNCDLVQSCRSN